MGIPSYFSYIVKNHGNIIKRLEKEREKTSSLFQISNLYLDCNSIVYDAVHGINFNQLEDSDVNTIIRVVISKIDEYIQLIRPSQFVFIAFDGVAPVAKLEQQRERRYKSTYQNEKMKQIYKNAKPDPWNTTAITPGTVFMSNLNTQIKQYYNNPGKYNVKSIILSASDHYGEGEHKLFDFIRRNPQYHTEDYKTVIYGLDADLIMLCINHLPISSSIYLFRETPHFIKTINSQLEPNETYLIDIPELARIITLDMCNGQVSLQQENRKYDYIFLCFFLGNDFLPHFPAINIRTGGVNKMVNAYKEMVQNGMVQNGVNNDFLTSGRTIYWSNVRKLVNILVPLEHTFIKTETKLRDRREQSNVFSVDTPDAEFQKFEALPTHDRRLERSINPFKVGWQERYYKLLFDVDVVNEELKERICLNYLQGLEWTMRYYTTGCVDWRWCYRYSYPPLLEDLVRYIPHEDGFSFFSNANAAVKPNPVNELVQLCYVLPKASLSFLPQPLYKLLLERHGNWYKNNCDFVWAYCRYFWESHVKLPEIDIHILEDLVDDYRNSKK